MVGIVLVMTGSVFGEKIYMPGQILVKFRAGMTDDKVGKALGHYKSQSKGKIGGGKLGQLHKVSVPVGAEEEYVQTLSQRSDVEFAELDEQVKPVAVPNDPSYGSAWHLPLMGAPTAWDSTSGAGITIAVLDTGVDSTHPDLAAHIVPGWNVYDNTSNTADVYGHGTEVAGAAAEIGNNGVGGVGVAYGAQIMPIRISDPSGYAYFSTMASGITFAADHGARLANISFENACGGASVMSAAQYMRGKGGVVVIAAGNTGAQTSAPASADIICVSATDSADARASWSSFGPSVDVAAPGVNIWATTNGGGYGFVSGTSFVSPVTAGTYALMMAAKPSLTPAQLDGFLFSTAKDLGAAGRDDYYGYGRVDIAAAVAAAKDTTTPVDITPPTVSMTAPTSGSSVSKLVTVQASAQDNGGIAAVKFTVDGVDLGTDSSSPYAATWDTTLFANGSHTLGAVAQDAAGNSATAACTIVVNNTVDTQAPAVAITSPTDGTVVSAKTASVTVKVNATDNVGVTRVDLFVDGVAAGSSTSAPFSIKWNTRKLAVGSHALQTKAVDAMGNVGVSATVSVRR